MGVWNSTVVGVLGLLSCLMQLCGFGRPLSLPGDFSLGVQDRLCARVVKVSALRAEGPGFESRLRRDFSGSSHTSDLKIGTPVATLPGARLFQCWEWSARCQCTVTG